jgi:23S rRNA pseudouridine1911/1915/1917 synthase
MQKHTLIVEGADSGRLDRYLADRFPSWSRTRLQRLIESGDILVDGRAVSPNEKIQNGQTVTISWPQPAIKVSKKPVVDITFPILHEDKDLIVVNKPAGLVVHPAVGHHDGNTLVEILEPKIASAPWPDDVRPGLVHRLDRDTSGVIVLAKTPEVQMKLSKQFSDRDVKKTYVGLVLGRVKPNEGTLESNLARHPGMRQRYAVVEKGRWALTKFKVIERFGDVASLLELYPFTGRTHQIRVQVAAFGHPIIGDHVYGPANKDFSHVVRHLLHAARLELTHPRSGTRKQFSAALPADFQSAIKLIRLNS